MRALLPSDGTLSRATDPAADLAPVLSAYLVERLEDLDESLGRVAGTMPGEEEWTEESVWYLVPLRLGRRSEG